MSEKINLTALIADLSKTVDFNEFYNVNIEIARSRITLQGNISPITTYIAKKLSVTLEYDNDSEMLKGETEDGKLRIVLT